jgi:hypothetical protein
MRRLEHTHSGLGTERTTSAGGAEAERCRRRGVSSAGAAGGQTSDVNRPVGRPGTVGRPRIPQDGRDGAKAVRPVLTPQ